MRPNVLDARCCLVLLVLSTYGCGGASSPTNAPPSPNVAASASGGALPASPHGCPDALDASVVLRIDSSNGPRWALHDREVDDDDLLLDDSDHQGRLLTKDEAGKLGASGQGTVAWVFYEAEAPPCRMEAGAPWAVHFGDGPLTTQLAYELSGDCPLDAKVDSYIALRGAAEVRGCRLHDLPTIASDETGKGTPVPSELGAVLPSQKCEGPACFRFLYTGAHVDDGTGIYEVAAVWIHQPEEGAPECSAPFDGFHGVYFRKGRQAAWIPVPEARDVRALMYDERGMRAMLTDSSGVLGLWVPGADGLPVKASDRRYMSWHEESRTRMGGLEPSCL